MSINLIAVRRNPRIWARRSNNYRQIKIEGIHKRMVRKTGCYPNWTPITTLTFYIWTVLPPNFHRSVRVLLNRVLQQRWIGRATKGDNHPLPWPPHLPDLTPYDFFLWGFVKDSVYVPPLPMSLNELRIRITHALQTITADTLLQSGMNLITVWMCVVWPRVHTLKDCD